MALLLDLPWNEIDELHTKMCEKCDAAVTDCSDILNSLLKDGQRIEQLDPLDILRALLENESTCIHFGTPERKPLTLPKGEDNSSEITRQRWGHKAHFHIQSLKQGLEQRQTICDTAEVARQLEFIHMLEDKFATVFNQCLPPVDELKRAMQPHANHRIFTHFILSRIDPILYSSLIYLNRKELRISTDLTDFLVENVKETLLQVLPFIQKMDMSPPINDDTNLWWGQYELLKREGENYQVGEYTGYSGAAEVCLDLICKYERECSTPSKELVFHEISPDVYTQKRTNLLIMKHCINISQLMPEKSDPKLSEQLSDIISGICNTEKGYSFYRMHSLGLGLEVSSVMKLYYQKYVENSESKTTGMEVAQGHVDEQAEISDPKLKNNQLESQALLFDTGVIQIEYSDKRETVSVAFENDTSFIRIISAIIDNGNAATMKQLQSITGIQDPGRCIKRALDNHEALRPHIIMPGIGKSGGYTTRNMKKGVIENETPDKEVDSDPR